MAQGILLEAKDLCFGVPSGRMLAENLSFRVQCGGLLLISGANGSGKSTLLKVLLGQQRARRGTIHWQTDKRSLGYLPQVQDSEVHLPFTLHDVLATNGAPTEKEILALGLLQKRHLPLDWNRASGGERKRTLLTRIFLANPSVLVLDEPFNHLDQESRALISTALYIYLQDTEAKRMAILVSHEQALEAKLAELPLARVKL